MSNFVRSFKKFQINKRNESLIQERKERKIKANKSKVNESVIERDNRFIVGGIDIPQSLVTGFASKVKKEQGKDLYHDYSKKELASELINYIVDTYGNVDDIPVSAILGGDDEMEEQVDDISVEEDPLDVEDDGMEEFDEEEFDIGELDDDEEDEDDLLGDIDDDFIGIDDDEDEEEEDIDFDDEDEDGELLDLPTEPLDDEEDI